MRSYYILIKGIVQGVGFRPFIKNLADTLSLKGVVINTSNGVEIRVTADETSLLNFINLINSKAPKLSIIKSIDYKSIELISFEEFSIDTTRDDSGFTFISPDVAICDDCVADIMDKDNRRYGYLFTNCTNCGPRYSIIKSTPYDRANTTMANFIMCDDCMSEYTDSRNRRFHAEPNACPKCGPKVELNYRGKIIYDSDEALATLCKAIDDGSIVAVKGLGGFHLITSAYSDSAVSKLRELKHRPTKPLAIMAKDISSAEKVVELTDDDRALIQSKEAPILLLKKRANGGLSELISPHTDKLGVMLAYTPLHRVILERCKTDFIVATSGNLHDEPIVADNDDAIKRLSIFTDIFLTHNRDIYTRLDDSVIAKYSEGYMMMRRSRAFAPFPIDISSSCSEVVLGVGANLKSNFAIYHNGYIIVSQYIGDLDNVYTSDYYEEVYNKILSTFKLKPTVAVTDLHSGFFSTKFGDSLLIKKIAVQHHIAHFLSVLAEHNFSGDAVGLILDGFGLGADGKAWGGEVFLKRKNIVTRVAQLKNYMQVGMDVSTKSPYKMLISYLHSMGLLDSRHEFIKKRFNISDNDIAFIKIMIDNEINSIQTSSAGRLFEAVGSLLFSERDNEYEGALAIRLEASITADGDDFYEFTYEFGEVGFKQVFESIFIDIDSGVDNSTVARRFHNGFARVMVDVVRGVAVAEDIEHIALSGGVFQNTYLTDKIIRGLRLAGLKPIINSSLPVNDASISVGQIYSYLNNIGFKN